MDRGTWQARPWNPKRVRLTEQQPTLRMSVLRTKYLSLAPSSVPYPLS